MTPTPTSSVSRTGPFGEAVVTVAIESPHRELKVEANSRVDVDRRAPSVQGPSDVWETVRDAALSQRDIGILAPAQFLFPTSLAPLDDAITEFGMKCFTPERSIMAAAFDLTLQINRGLKFKSGTTGVRTSASEAFRAGQGVCQDFSHIMISALHGIGLPAAYVSGYIRTIPPAGQPRLVGADASHAWVMAWCGPALGWVGFDPTNDLLVENDHIVLAVGRDFSDVSPVDGVIVGSRKQKLGVAVDVLLVE